MKTEIGKAGRPRFNDELIKHYKAFFPDIRTRRGLQDKYYSGVALRVINDLEGMDFFWVTDETGKRISMKSSLLAELGRFEDGDDIKKIAISICKAKEKRTVKEWIAILRAARR